MKILKSANVALRFLLELCVLAAIGYWGFKSQSGWLAKILLGIILPILVAGIWGRFGAPKSPAQLHGIMLLGLEVLVFGSGVAALFASGQITLAWSFVVVVLANRVLMFVWRQ